MKTRTRLAALTALFPLLAACGATVEPAPAPAAGQSATVANCGEQATYPIPQRAVSYDISGTEKMFALGLADRMRGYVLNKVADPSIDGSEYKADYAKVPRLGTARITREIVVDAQADFVFAGWNSGFSEERGITPKLLEQLGIRSYLHTETCWDYGTAKADVSPLDALFADLENLGKIFHVEARATELVGQLRGRLDAVRKGVPAGAEPARVFVYDSGTDQPYTAGKHAAPTDIIAAAGGRNVFGELADGWGSVGWEPVVQAQPEVIVVVDYGDQPAQQKIDFVKSFEGLKNSPAVRENRFHVMSIGELVSGPRNIAGAENLAGYLRSVGR